MQNGQSRSISSRRTLAAAFFVAAHFIAGAHNGSGVARAEQSANAPTIDFARIVPGDADFYVEVSNLSELRASFQSLGIWQALRETLEGDVPSTQPWQNRSEQLLGMSSEELIVRVLGKRAALFAKRSDDWQNGVLIAEIESQLSLRVLLQDWRARPLADEGAVRRYLLRGNLLCAVLDRTILLGPPDDPDGLWGRSVLLMTGRGPHLAGQSAFASLRSRLTSEPDAMVFARWPDDYPYAFANCERLMLSMQFDGAKTSCSLYGRRRTPKHDEPRINSDILRRASGSAIALWAGALNEASTSPSDDTLAPTGPGEFLHQIIAKLPAWRSTGPSLLASIDPCVLLQLGSLKTDDFHFPTLTLTMRSEEAASIVRQLDPVLVLFTQMIAIFATSTGGTTDMPDVEHIEAAGADLRRIDLGRVLARRSGLAFLRPMKLAWTADGKDVIIGTSAESVTESIQARHNPGNSTSPIQAALRELHNDNEESMAEFGYIRGESVSEMLNSWITFAEQRHPEVVDNGWWQVWIASKLAEESRLGVGMVDDETAPGRAIVKEISPTSPAALFLRENDVVVGIFGKPLDAKHAARSVADRYERRGDADVLSLDVIRDGNRIQLDIPVPKPPKLTSLNIRPVTALRRLAGLLSGIESASYVRVSNDPSNLDVRVVVRWSARGAEQSTTSR
ncbi:MAG: hypothetical protein H6818_09565 [Phycisphaerales bacterium]|nr:hypothetical protein [Phycisphaerales bacterium]MCB9864099.1 hypothetical protein [Phycisphaerales bacterium]